MPKVLVLFDGRSGNAAALAGAIAEGAESVRFTEVDVRRVADVAPAADSDADEAAHAGAPLMKKYRSLESVESLAQYDALIIGGAARDGKVSGVLVGTLERAARLGEGRPFADKVGSAFGGVPMADREANMMSMLTPLMRLGMIIVPPALGAAHPVSANGAPSAEELAAARQLGARVAKVAEWVRHAKSHESHGHRH